MGLFNKIGKFFGGIANAVVPGFSALSKTGMFGDDLKAMAGGTASQPVAQVINRSPGLVASAETAPVRTAPPALGGGPMVSIPREYLNALVQENRRIRASYVPPQAYGAFPTTQATTPLQNVRANLPVNPVTSFYRFPTQVGVR